MKKYLLIAEKPSLMRDIRNTYKTHIADIQAKVGEVDFIALAGHVCRLLQPKEYEKWDCKWADIELPMIPAAFKIGPIASSKNIIADIKKKMKETKYDGIIVATDADVEGNGIYYLLSEYLGLRKMHTLRYFINDQTDAELFKSFLNMTDYWKNPRDVNMTKSFLIRSHMDWLIGMNFTTGASVASGLTMKVGRVKSPTLKLVYDNCKAIDEFIPHTDYGIDAEYKEGFTGSLLDEEGKIRRFEEKEKAEEYYSRLSKTGTVTSVTKKLEKSNAPQLYNLSDLQTEAGGKYGYSPAKTLELVQSLYEVHKIVSYPRTDGRCVSTEKAKEFSKLLKTASYFPELQPFTDKVTAADIKRAQGNKKVVNDAEVAKSSHDALLPTTQKPNIEKLNVDERNVCILIYKRFITQFMEALEENKTTIFIKIDDDTFKSTGKTVEKSGWTAIYDKKSEDKELPDLKKGDTVTVSKFIPSEKTTQPPKRYTQATLVAAMVNINKYIEDKGLQKMMKEVEGLGTQASRASIISDLIKDGYMEEKGGKKAKGLYMTEKGTQYIENLLSYDIIKPEMTAIWETKMKEIRTGEADFEKVNEEMLDYVKKTVSAMEKTPMKRVSSVTATGLTCPVCGGVVRSGKYGWYCVNKLSEKCTFTIPSELCKKKITETIAKELCKKKKTKKITGFKSKAGKSFSASLIVKDGKTAFDFS